MKPYIKHIPWKKQNPGAAVEGQTGCGVPYGHSFHQVQDTSRDFTAFSPETDDFISGSAGLFIPLFSV